MTDSIKLLPLPGGNVAHLISAQAAEIEELQAENKRLRKSLAALKADNEMLRKVLKEADNELDWLNEMDNPPVIMGDERVER